MHPDTLQGSSWAQLAPDLQGICKALVFDRLEQTSAFVEGLHPDAQGICKAFAKIIFGPVILLIAYDLALICSTFAGLEGLHPCISHAVVDYMNNAMYGPHKLTQAIAKQYLQSIGCTFRKTEFGEYRVNVRGLNEDSAYYTDCLLDAVNTGVYMIGVTNGTV